MCDIMFCIVCVQIEPSEVLQAMAERISERASSDASWADIEVTDVVVATRVPVLKLLDAQSNLEVRRMLRQPAAVTLAEEYSVLSF